MIALGVFKRSAIPFMLKHLVTGSITWNLIEELPQFTTRILLFFRIDDAVLAAAIFRTLNFVCYDHGGYNNKNDYLG